MRREKQRVSGFHPVRFRFRGCGAGPKRPPFQKLLRYNGVFNASICLGYCHKLNICAPQRSCLRLYLGGMVVGWRAFGGGGIGIKGV